MVARTKGREPEPAADWLDRELRQTNARLHKVESELDQALKRVWSLDADMRKLTGALSVSGSAASQISALREELRQLHDQLSRLQDRQPALSTRIEEVLRQRKTETGREKQELAALAKQMETLAKSVDHFDSRMLALEEVCRHVEEQVAGARLANHGLERSLDDAAGRVARSVEATVRLEQELARAAGEIDSLRKGDEALEDRIRLLLEQVRRLSERSDKLESIAAFPQEARELLQRATFEREQLTQRLAAVEKLSTEVSERLQEFVQTLARLDQRGQTQGAQLMDLLGQLQELTEQTKGQMKRMLQSLLRQRRRQAEALAQEIKELSQGEFHSGD